MKYAERDARRPDHFIGGDPHDVAMSMDYFVWAIVGEGRTWVEDSIAPGHDPRVSERHPAADSSLSDIAVRLG